MGQIKNGFLNISPCKRLKLKKKPDARLNIQFNPLSVLLSKFPFNFSYLMCILI